MNFVLEITTLTLFYLQAPPVIEYEFCAQLTPNYQVSWTISATENIGMFQLCSCITSGS